MKNHKKKILFASKDLSVGGMENALITLLANLDFSKYDVTLVLENIKGALLKKLEPKVKTVRYKVWNNKFVPLRKALNLISRLSFTVFHGGKYDFSCAYATYSVPCSTAARIASKNNMLYVHSDYFEMYKDNPGKAKEFFTSVSFEKFRRIVFVSQSAMNNAARFYEKNISERFSVLGNICDVNQVKELSEERPPDLKEKKNGIKTFIFVGRLDDTSKKLKRFFDAAFILKKKNFSFDVVVVGDGPDGEMYRKYVKDMGLLETVCFLGEKTNPYPYIKNSDCLVITSDYEGFPVVYSEAAVLGVPVITTVPASDGFISVNEETAYITKKNPESVAYAMERVICGDKLEEIFFDPDNANMQKMQNLYKMVDDLSYVLS